MRGSSLRPTVVDVCLMRQSLPTRGRLMRPFLVEVRYAMTKSSNKGQVLEAHCGQSPLTTRQSSSTRGISLRLFGLKSVEREEVLRWEANLWDHPSQWQCEPKNFSLSNDTASWPTPCPVVYHSQFPNSSYHPFCRITSPSSRYTGLFPKCPGITGDVDQAYHRRFEDYFDYLLSGIGAGTIAAIGAIAPGSTSPTYIYAPQIHTNLRRRIKGFIGNTLNKLGKFSCVHIDSSAFSLLPVIASKSNMDNSIPAQTGVIPLNSKSLTSTRWAPSSDEVTGSL